MNIIPINFSDFDLVDLKPIRAERKDRLILKPYCKKHGAMNKMNKLEDGGGYWRCITFIVNGNETPCRAGCCEIRK